MATLADLKNKLQSMFNSASNSTFVQRGRAGAQAATNYPTNKVKLLSGLSKVQNAYETTVPGQVALGLGKTFVNKPIDTGRAIADFAYEYRNKPIDSKPIRDLAGRGLNLGLSLLAFSSPAGIKTLGAYSGLDAGINTILNKGNIGKGAMATAKSLPTIIPKAGLYSVTNPLTEKALVAKGVTKFLPKNIARGAVNVAEDIVTSRLGIDPDLTKSQAVASFLLPGVMDALGKPLSKLFAKEVPKVLKDANGDKVIGKYKNYLKILTKQGQTIYYDNTIKKIVPQPTVERIVRREIPFTVMGVPQKPFIEKDRVTEPLFGGLAGIEPYQDEEGKWKVKFNPGRAAAGVAIGAGIKQMGRIGGDDSIEAAEKAIYSKKKALMDQIQSLRAKGLKPTDPELGKLYGQASNLQGSDITNFRDLLAKPNKTPEDIERLEGLANVYKDIPYFQSFKNQSGAINLGADVGGKERGFVSSVKESPKVSAETKFQTKGRYTPKANEVLMGEAKALLTEGANVNFKNVKNIDQKVAATIQEAINLDKAGNHDAAAALFNNLSEQGTELGRGVQAFSLLDKMSPEAISLSAAGKIRKYNLTAGKKIPELSGDQQKMIANAVENIRNMPKGRERNIAIHELNNTINDFVPSALTDKIITVWKAGLLTSLRTHERNLIGNALMSAAEIAKDPVAALTDAALGLRTGKRTTTFALKGIEEGFSKKTGTQIKDLLTKGFDPEQDISKFDIKRITWSKSPLQQTLKRYTDVVFRTLATEDRPFWNAAYGRSLYDQAGAEAINAGKAGNKAFIKELVTKPTDDMLKIATSDANYATFHDKNTVSKVASAIKRAAQDPNNGPMGAALGRLSTEFALPFTGVPSSIVGKTIAYSPIGLIRGAIDAGRVAAGQVPELQRQASQEVGRGLLGTGLFGLGAYLMSKGLMTGQPKDLEEANQWQLEGKQANSVLINGKWRNINSVGPQTLVVLAGAKYNEEMGKPDGSVGAYAGGLAKDQLQQTFLAGVQQPLNAITDPVRYGKSYAGNFTSSFVPNIVKDTAKSMDNTVRETNNVGDYLKNSLPSFRNTLTPKRDVLGNEIKQEPTGVGAFVDLFNSKTPISNKVVDELSRLNKADTGATPGKLQKSQTIAGEKRVLTPQQLDQLEADIGPKVRSELEALFNSEIYKKLSDEERASAVSTVVAKVRKEVRGSIKIGQDVPSGSAIAAEEHTPQTPYLASKYVLINESTGKKTTVDLSTPIQSPKLSGIKELDEGLISTYNSKITSRIKNVEKVYLDGQITAQEAADEINKLKADKITKETKKKAAKPKVIKFTEAPKTKLTKVKIKKVSLPRIKARKLAAATIKSKKYAKYKLAKFRNTLSGSLTKLA